MKLATYTPGNVQSGGANAVARQLGSLGAA